MKFLIAACLVLMSVPSAAQTPEWRANVLHAAIGASMVAHGSDIGVSLYAFGHDPDRYREANPILRPFSDKPALFGATKMALAVGVNYALLKLHPRHPRVTLAIAIAQAVAVGYVARRNSQQIR